MSIESEFSKAINDSKITGAIILACDSKGHEYQKLLGERILPSGEKQPFQPDNDILFLASATKFLTTLAALTCVEDGLLSLDEPIKTEGLPNEVLISMDGDQPDMKPAKDITLRQLLTHTSGLVYHFTNPMISVWRDKHSPLFTRGGPLPPDQLFCYPLAFQPGTSWMYGCSLDWAGVLISRVAGEPLSKRLQERVLFTKDAEFYPAKSLHDRKIDNNPWDDGAGKAVLGGDATMQKNTDGEAGGHGLFCTAPTYLNVLRSILKNDGKILSPEMVHLMFEDHLKDGREGFDQACNGPVGPFYRCGTMQKVGFGLGGLLTLEDVPGWYGDRTMTWGGGMTFSWFIDRQNDLCGLCAIQQTLPMDVGLVEGLKQTYRRDIYEQTKSWR